MRNVRSGESAGWRPTTLPGLGNAINCPDWRELTDTLKRLNQQGIIQMRKWGGASGFILYSAEERDEEFFHRADFQISITPVGRTYSEKLEEQEKTERLGLWPWESFFRQMTQYRNLLQHVTFPATELARLSGLGLETERALSHAKQLREASQNAVEVLSRSQPSLEETRKIALLLQPIVGQYQQIGRQLAEQIQQHNSLFRLALVGAHFQEVMSAISGQTKLLERINVDLAAEARKQWSADLLGQRVGLIEEVLKNLGAWQNLQLEWTRNIRTTEIGPEVLDIGRQFILDQGLFVRRLPPPIPLPEEIRKDAEELRIRDQEVGAKLEAALARLDQRLVGLRRQAWANLTKGDPASARLAAHGIREVYSEILRLLAPDEEIIQTELWRNRHDQSLAKPTRRMRIEFIVGPLAAELNTLVQFDQSIQAANKFAHTFAEDTELVRVHLAQVENCIYLLVVYALRKKPLA